MREAIVVGVGSYAASTTVQPVSDSDAPMMVLGSPGSGKSALLQQVLLAAMSEVRTAQRIEESAKRILIFDCCCASDTLEVDLLFDHHLRDRRQSKRAFTPEALPRTQPSCIPPKLVDSTVRHFLTVWGPPSAHLRCDVDDVPDFQRRRRRTRLLIKALTQRAARSLGFTGEAARDLLGHALAMLRSLLVSAPPCGADSRPPSSRLVVQFRTALVGTLTRNAPPQSA